jgi:hypothetical protein
MTRLILLLSFFFSFFTARQFPVERNIMPLTGDQRDTSSQVENYSKLPSLREFIPTIINGNPRQLVGVFIDDTLALHVVQQPSSNPGFVSSEPDVVTEFSLAAQYGTTGLLAHNTAAGEYFAEITTGRRIVLVYGNGSLKYFRVNQIRQFQALSPNSPYSNFADLDAPEKTLSVETLFYQIYQGDGNLVFQTCIERDGQASWGRLFVIAEPIEAQRQTNIFSVTHLNYSLILSHSLY